MTEAPKPRVEWPTEMLKGLDASLKLQSIQADPDHAWIGPSVIELATEAYLAEKSRAEKAEADYLKMRDGHEHVVHKMSEELAAEKEAREKLQAALIQVTEMNRETIKHVETLVARFDKLKTEFSLATQALEIEKRAHAYADLQNKCELKNLKAERQVLVDAMKEIINWENDLRPDDVIAREALKKVGEL